MTSEEQLNFCKVCKYGKPDSNQGMICELTNQVAGFDHSCDYFVEVPRQKQEGNPEKPDHKITVRMASQGKRLTNYLLDLLFDIIFSFFFGVFLGMVLAIVSPDSLKIFQEDNMLINYLFGFVTGMIYYTALEYTTGRTIAKFITKTRVVNEDGTTPDFRTILIRSLCRFIPFEPFSFLFAENTGWHDTLSKTKVIEV